MHYLLEIDKDCLSLSLSEALAVTRATKHIIDENILTLETVDTSLKSKVSSPTSQTLVKRLSLTRAVYQHLFTTTRKKLSDSISAYQWTIREQIKVETRNATEKERKEVITITCKTLKNPNVSMKEPQTTIMYIYTKKKVHCGIFLGEPIQDTSRAMSNLPAPHPSAMKPRIVKALINIAQPVTSILDPFCGAGGFLVEAATIGIPVEGWDIDRGMLWRARKNTQSFKNVTIKDKDARTLKEADAIIADLPYGKNTRAQDITTLYKEFFRTLKSATFNKAILVLPKHAHPLALAKKEGLHILRHHEMYIHGSLTRVVMEVEGKHEA